MAPVEYSKCTSETNVRAVQDQWYRRAQLALDKGEEELARDALRRKKSFSDTAAMLKKQLDHHTRATSQLTTNIRCCHIPVLRKSKLPFDSAWFRLLVMRILC